MDTDFKSRNECFKMTDSELCATIKFNAIFCVYKSNSFVIFFFLEILQLCHLCRVKTTLKGFPSQTHLFFLAVNSKNYPMKIEFSLCWLSRQSEFF